MIAFRCTDPRFPFLWERADQPDGRWHREGEGPVHYLADTPHGAWAELLRHEEIRDEEDLTGIRRALWAVEVGELPEQRATLGPSSLRGSRETWAVCQAEARRLRDLGESGLRAPSAALLPGGAAGTRVEGGPRPGPARDGEVLVLFGLRPDLVGWPVVVDGRPPREVLGRVNHL